MSRSESELDSASLRVGSGQSVGLRRSLQSMVKQRVKEAIGLSGVVGGSAWRSISRGTWEARSLLSAGVGQPIVARKRVMTVERRG